SRTPVQWNNNENGGFTEGTPWIDVAKNYSLINVQNSLDDEESVFYHYKKLIELRKKYKVISHGDFTPMYEESLGIFGYIREFEAEKILVINNFYENEIEVEIPEEFVRKEVLIKNYENILLNKNKVTLRPYESIAFLTL
ncbi:MAG: alpha-glucosidase C-terminal domain-containing protein, partial [Cetobacterium sp.]